MSISRWRANAAAIPVFAALGLLAACGKTADDAPRDARSVSRDSLIIDGASPSCSTCTLHIAAPVAIGSPDDADIPQRVPEVLRDRRGNYLLVFNGWSDKPILRYDAAGHFQGKLGRTGNGPGEYTMTMRVVLGRADSVFVFAGPRGQVFGPDGRYARTVGASDHRALPLKVSR